MGDRSCGNVSSSAACTASPPLLLLAAAAAASCGNVSSSAACTASHPLLLLAAAAAASFFYQQYYESPRQSLFNFQPKVSKCQFHIRILGIVIDKTISWEPHSNYIRKKIAKRIGIISKAKQYLKKATLLTLYNSLILPYLSYDLEVWGVKAGDAL